MFVASEVTQLASHPTEILCIVRFRHPSAPRRARAPPTRIPPLAISPEPFNGRNRKTFKPERFYPRRASYPARNPEPLNKAWEYTTPTPNPCFSTM
jgi:hypothetical protein